MDYVKSGRALILKPLSLLRKISDKKLRQFQEYYKRLIYPTNSFISAIPLRLQ